MYRAEEFGRHFNQFADRFLSRPSTLQLSPTEQKCCEAPTDAAAHYQEEVAS
jgi:hypothetical protein